MSLTHGKYEQCGLVHVIQLQVCCGLGLFRLHGGLTASVLIQSSIWSESRRSSFPVPSFADLHTPDGSNSLDLALLAGPDLRLVGPADDEEPAAANARHPRASLEATVARPGPMRRRGSVSEEVAFAVAVRPLLLRVHLEGWDLAAACVQQHMSAVGVGFGVARRSRQEDAPQAAAAANEPSNAPTGTDEAARRPVVVEQRLVQLDAPQLRLEVVANELPRAIRRLFAFMLHKCGAEDTHGPRGYRRLWLLCKPPRKRKTYSCWEDVQSAGCYLECDTCRRQCRPSWE